MTRFDDFGPDLLRAALDLALFALLALVLFALAALLQSLVPTVHREWPSGRCVRVLDGPAEGECGDLPPVYDTVWIAAGGRR